VALGQSEVRDLIGDQLFKAYKAERTRLDRIDSWWRWDHDKPHSPRSSTTEYKELSARAQTPWLGLVVTSVAQSMYVEGYRHAGEGDNVASWSAWQANGMDRRQIAVHRAAIGYGYSHVSVLPGRDPLTGAEIPEMRGISPRNSIAFYLDPVNDDWPAWFMHVESAKVDGRDGYVLKVYDDEQVWRFHANANGDVLTYITVEEHGVGVCPVVRFANMLDLEGRQDGEVEPFIPVAARIDQTTFDRLVVQRFASWVVRTVTGMSPPEQLTDETDDEYRTRTKLRLAVEDILIADDPDTKFGSLPATALDGFIAAADADIRVLAAVTQTPPHHLLGQIANLSAEALAAAEASLTRKVEERKHSFGESWEQALRLASWVSGDTEAAADTDAQVRWRDMESRSLAQAADALGKLAQMLQVPVEMLWEKIPGFTDQDVERAKALAAESGGIDALFRDLNDAATPAADTGAAELKAKSEALGVLIRAGVDPDSAAEQVGMPGLEMTGAVPVSLRQPETEAAKLEQA
jgi:hypothetical protein